MEIRKIGGNAQATSVANAAFVEAALAAQAANTAKEKRALVQEIENMKAEGEKLRLQMENAKQQGKAAAKQYDTLRKCMIIAMRIMDGDIVPKEDYRFLAEHEPEMYKRAIFLRQQKEDPEKHKRLSEDDKAEKHGIYGAAEIKKASRAAGVVEALPAASGQEPDVTQQ